MSEPLDIVYMVKASEANDQLRYSLRSLANLPHGRVWLVGYKPRWVHNIGYIPTMQRGPKPHNTWRNWAAMATSTELPDRWLLFNDDFYVTQPTPAVRLMHRGELGAAIEWLRSVGANHYRLRMEATRRALVRAARPEPHYSYELHAPMVMERAAHADSIQWLERHRIAPPENMAKRSFYGNWAQAGGVQVADVKVQGSKDGLPCTELPFLSTCPASWGGLAGAWVRREFATPSTYETRPGDGLWRPPVEQGARRGR